MIQEPITPQILEQQQQQQRQFRTKYTNEPLKTYPIQTRILSSQAQPRYLLIQNSATSPVVTRLVALPRKQAKTQTRIIRIPFLPRSEPIAVLVKQSLPTENGSVKNSNQDTELSETTNCYYTRANYRHLTESISSNTCNYSSNSIGSDQRNQNCCQILYLNQSQNKNQLNQTKNQELLPQKPMTLASMAGIQLTSADESPQTMEMSGAMQPTATVEEINVPVFIDEYLQQSTQTSSTTTPTTTTGTLEEEATFTNNSNYTLYNCENNDDNNNNNNHNYNGNNIICLDNETFENLDFDIEMIEDTNSMMTSIGEKMENDNMDFYYCNNSSSNNNTYNNNNNNTYIPELELKVEPQFQTAPGIEHDFLSEDLTYSSLDQDMGAAYSLSNEEAIDISHISNDFPVFSCSQNDPMFTEGQKFTQELQKSEPIIEPDDEYEQYKSSKQQDMQQQTTYHQHVAIVAPELAFETAALATPLKRKQQQRSSSPSMQEKRRKLKLNTKFSISNVPQTLNTPDLINSLVDQQPQIEPAFNTVTADEIMKYLLDSSNSADELPFNISADTTCWTALIDSSDDTTIQNITTETANSDDTYESYDIICKDEEDETPYTPSSSTNHTIPNSFSINFSSPNSPAISINSTTSNSALRQQTQKRRRGRPSKEHSDQPDPEQLEHVSETERKRLEDRAKNNEASRISRLKNKHKEEAEIKEQEELMVKNIKMKEELEYLERVTKKLKSALHRRQMLHKR